MLTLTGVGAKSQRPWLVWGEPSTLKSAWGLAGMFGLGWAKVFCAKCLTVVPAAVYEWVIIGAFNAVVLKSAVWSAACAFVIQVEAF